MSEDVDMLFDEKGAYGRGRGRERERFVLEVVQTYTHHTHGTGEVAFR